MFVKNRIKYPDVALAQSMWETGHFKSNVFKSNFNLFGMKKPEKRPTTATGENRGHAQYKNWVDSVKDYKMWQDSQKKLSLLPKNQYIDNLNLMYCIPPPKGDCNIKDYGKMINGLITKANSIISKSKNV